jgi:hypothetical protein
MFSNFWKDRTLTFITFYSTFLSYFAITLLYSFVEKVNFFQLFLIHGLIITFATFSLELLPLFLLILFTVIFSVFIIDRSKNQVITYKNIGKIIFLSLFCSMIFIPLQMFVAGFLAEFLAALNEKLGGRL